MVYSNENKKCNSQKSYCEPKYFKEDDPYTSDPAILPVSVDKVKSYLKIPTIETSLDERIQDLILLVSEKLECEFGFSLILTNWHKQQTGFFDGCDNDIRIAIRPVSEIVSVRYLDVDGEWQEVDSQEYQIVTDKLNFGNIIFKNDFVEPEDMADSPYNLDIEFTAGFEKLPFDIAEYISWTVGAMLSNSPDCQDTACNKQGLPCGMWHLLDCYLDKSSLWMVV